MTRGRGWPAYTGPQLTAYDEARLMRGEKLEAIVADREKREAKLPFPLAGSAVARVEERRREAKARALAMANGEASSGILASGGSGYLETWTEEEWEAQSCRAFTPGDLCGGCPSCLSKQYPEGFRTLTLAEAWEEGELRETIALPACPVPHGEYSVSCVACRGFEVVKLPVADACECDGARKEHPLTGESVCARCNSRGHVPVPAQNMHSSVAPSEPTSPSPPHSRHGALPSTNPRWLYDAVEEQVKANRIEHDAWAASVSERGDPDVPFSSMTRIEAAEAKRERKAAKRRRDAELSRLGHADGREIIAQVMQAPGNRSVNALVLHGLESGDWSDYEHGAHIVRWLRRRDHVARRIAARRIRRGEVVP